MPLVQTRGAASAQGFGEFAQVTAVNYIEDVFSTYLYTATGATQSITNGIDLSTKGGLVWIKDRTLAYDHCLFDTSRGAGKTLFSDLTNAQYTDNASLTSFNTNGFTLGVDSNLGYVNNAGNLVSWTFREQPKFFDIVTYTGTGSNATISHNLGSEPGCIIVKRTDTAGQNWYVYHRGASAGNKYLILNRTDAEDSGFFWTPTSTTFDVSSTLGLTANGGTYICYLFAHNAGGFGLAGTDNVISCGGYTGNNSTVLTNLGYEPQLVIIRNVTSGISPQGDWKMIDNMRGFTASNNSAILRANLVDVENNDNPITIASNGFYNNNMRTSANNYIYIAIRRGPMKVPTLGTSVFTPIARTGTGAAATVTLGNLPDLLIGANRASAYPLVYDRLRGVNRTDQALGTYSTGSETSIGAPTNTVTALNNISYAVGTDGSGYSVNNSGVALVSWNFSRAPSFFDEACYTGTGSATTFSHNLTVVPELIIVKKRSAIGNGWGTYSATTGASKFLELNNNGAAGTPSPATGYWNSTTPTSSVFSVGTYSDVNASGATYVAYLFATCAGVSKVGSYTGNGTTQTIDCGFGAGGARFVLIKRTDASGDWYTYDTARGMTVLTDPYLLLDSTAAETATLGSVTTVSTGFALNSTILAAINVNAGTYIFLAIA